ncbi:hypothetical protein AB1M95_17970 [Sulfitobacter sp. LCG007]
MTLFAANVAASWIDSFFSRHDLPNPHLAIQSHFQIALRRSPFTISSPACMPEPLVQSFAGANLREIKV